MLTNAGQLLAAGILSVSFWVWPATLGAQTQTPPSPSAPAPGLVLSGLASGGYDANAFPAAASASPTTQNPLFEGRSTNFGGDLQLSYVPFEGRRVSFGASGGSSFRAYTGSDFIPASHFGGAGISLGLTKHITFTGSATANYSPRYQFDLYPSLGQEALGQAAPQPLEYSLSLFQTFEYATSVDLSYRPTKRSSIELTHGFRDIQTDRQSLFRGRTQEAGALYHMSITKGLGLRVGYRSQQTEYADPSASGGVIPVRVDGIDVGLDYGLSHGLRLSPRTTLTFGFGTAAFNTQGYTRYHLVGDAGLTRGFARTWNLTGAYSRGMGFVDGLTAPIFSDSFNLRLTGGVTRRVMLNGTIAYSFGGLDVTSAVDRFHSVRSTVGLRGRFTRRLGPFVEYFYYKHLFDQATFRIQNVPPELRRQGVRAGLTFSLRLTGPQIPAAPPQLP